MNVHLQLLGYLLQSWLLGDRTKKAMMMDVVPDTSDNIEVTSKRSAVPLIGLL